MTVTAISAVVPRRPTVVAGRVVSMAAYVRPWVRFVVELCDGTGTITLRFMGRTEIPGIVPGRRLQVEGTPSPEFDTLIILNPLYTFLPEEYPPECVQRSNR
jgi:hypothetical protein